MKRIFERTKIIARFPAIERVVIKGESISNKITDVNSGRVITAWSCTLESMGHKAEKDLVDTLKLFHYKEVTQ